MGDAVLTWSSARWKTHLRNFPGPRFNSHGLEFVFWAPFLENTPKLSWSGVPPVMCLGIAIAAMTAHFCQVAFRPTDLLTSRYFLLHGSKNDPSCCQVRMLGLLRMHPMEQ